MARSVALVATLLALLESSHTRGDAAMALLTPDADGVLPCHRLRRLGAPPGSPVRLALEALDAAMPSWERVRDALGGTRGARRTSTCRRARTSGRNRRRR